MNVRGRAWTVVDATAYADCAVVRLRGAQADNAGEERLLLTPFDRLRPIARRTSWRQVRPRRWLHALRRAALDTHPFGTLRTTDASRIDLHPYQLEPALALLRHGATRILIADAVGLGKTIQAGLILRELAARRDEFRALIVLPASLREQWRDELRTHFGLAAIDADAAWLRGVARTLPPDLNPWTLPGLYVCSFDFLKRPEVLRPIEEAIWDLVVVDEAHAAAPATHRRTAVDVVAARARRIVLLTATPHNGDPNEFASLCRIGQTDARDPIVMFQRSRSDAGCDRQRRTVVLPVRPSRAERRMHRLLERYATRIDSESKARNDTRAALAAVVLRKRALSSATSLNASASRRRELLAGREMACEQQLALPLADEDPLDDGAPDDVLAVAGLSDAALEQRELEAVARASRVAAAAETKLAALLRLLRRVQEPVIVFTEYRDTLATIARGVERAGHAPLALHGGMTPADRAEAQRAFNECGRLLLATDAASEGLNLHHRCRIVVHYELPWSPLRLQQRTGRVDRIGQTRTVHEILLVASDTAERLVLAPLARRVAAANHATADAGGLFTCLSESRVTASILAGTAIEDPVIAMDRVAGQGDAYSSLDLREDARLETARLRRRRRWRERSSRSRLRTGDAARRLWTTRRDRKTAPSVTVVYLMVITAADGDVVHTDFLPIRFDGNVACADGFAAQLDAIARPCLEECIRRTVEQTASRQENVLAAARRREQSIAATIPDLSKRLVQAGLFERRAQRRLETDDRAANAVVADVEQRVAEIDARGQLSVSLDLWGVWISGPAQRFRP